MAVKQTNINPTFSINDYDKPRYMSKMESYASDVMMILLGKPGFYPSIPSLGMDVQKYLYMFEDEISTEAIKAELVEQCRDFSIEINSGDMDVLTTLWKERLMIIFILPIINDTKKVSMAIGITTNEYGQIAYEFAENIQQTI